MITLWGAAWIVGFVCLTILAVFATDRLREENRALREQLKVKNTQRRKVYINIYKESDPGHVCGFATREACDTKGIAKGRIACVEREIEFIEGEGL